MRLSLEVFMQHNTRFDCRIEQLVTHIKDEPTAEEDANAPKDSEG